jgi:hypothetical protein
MVFVFFETEAGTFIKMYSVKLCTCVLMDCIIPKRIKYIQHKPICHLCKMCNIFFYEFQVILSAGVLQLVCYLRYYAPQCKLEI